MRDACRMQRVQCASHLEEHSSQVLLIVLSLCLVEEINQLDARDYFHDQEGNLTGLSISLCPSGVFHEFKILGDCGQIDALDDCYLCLRSFDEPGFISCVRFEYLHGVLHAILLNELDDRIATLAECT